MKIIQQYKEVWNYLYLEMELRINYGNGNELINYTVMIHLLFYCTAQLILVKIQICSFINTSKALRGLVNQ